MFDLYWNLSGAMTMSVMDDIMAEVFMAEETLPTEDAVVVVSDASEGEAPYEVFSGLTVMQVNQQRTATQLHLNHFGGGRRRIDINTSVFSAA